MKEKRKILLIDDESVIQSLCRRLLAKMGHEVTIAGGVREGLETIDRSSNLELLITDMRLPDGDALEAMRLFKNRYPSAKILMITGTLTIPKEIMTQLENMGISENDILYKPFDTTSFESAVLQCLNGHHT